jgi:hypothetical protein
VVLQRRGEPAAGVPVRLTPRRVFNGASSPSTLKATTDGRGGFAFGEVADGEYEVHTEKTDRYDRAAKVVRAGMDAVVLVVEPIAEGVLSIRGVVESANGGALQGVRVQAVGEADVATTTDARGAYALRLPGGKAERAALQFRRDGYRDRRWAIADGERAGDHEVIGNVRLDPDAAGVTVTGVVTSTDGAPVARAQVQLNDAARGRSYRATSDSDGHFTIANVETGSGYRLWVRPQKGFRDGILENVLVDAATLLAVELAPIGVATLRGRMVTPDGAAVPGFTLFLATANAGGRRSPSVTSDGQGRFIAAGLPEGRVALQTRAAPAISVSGIELSAARPDTDVTVVVDVGAHRLEGRLITSDGEPAAGATVALESSVSIGGVTSQSSRQTITDAGGNFTFTQLGGGIHVLSAALSGAGSVRVEHSIAAGMAPLHLTLPGKRGRQ